MQNGAAASFYLLPPAGQASEKAADPLLHLDPASQTQVSCRRLPRPAPDRLIGIKVRTLMRQIPQPQVQPRRAQVFPTAAPLVSLPKGVGALSQITFSRPSCFSRNCPPAQTNLPAEGEMEGDSESHAQGDVASGDREGVGDPQSHLQEIHGC